MNKITEEHCLEDDGLVHFLQTYSPTPPKEKKPCEELVMRNIFQETTNKSNLPNRQKLFWLLPITLISSLLMLSGHVFKQKLLPQIASGYEDMETFMINSWHGSMVEEESEDFFYTAVSIE